MNDATQAASAPALSGLTLDYFDRPVVIPFSMREHRELEDGEIEIIDHRCTVKLRRETVEEAKRSGMAALVAASANGDSLAPELIRFCGLIAEEPTGFVGFPADERPLQERAFEYFKHPGMGVMIAMILKSYESVIYPAPLFRGL